MKTKIIFLVIALAALHLTTKALKTIGTSTFAPTCIPIVSVAPIANTYGCYSHTVTNNNISTLSSEFLWNFDDGSTANGFTVFHCYSPSTVTVVHTYTVTYTGPFQCSGLPNYYVGTVSVAPPPSTLCVGQTMTATAIGPLSYSINTSLLPITQIYTYLLDFGDGSLPSPPSTFTHTYGACGNYIVTLQRILISVPSLPDCYNYGAVNSLCATTTGINESYLDNLISEFYPNPCTTQLKADLIETPNYLRVYDVVGREVPLQYQISDTKLQMDVSNLPKGMYLIKLRFSNNKEVVKRYVQH
jgi:hypothetical protein